MASSNSRCASSKKNTSLGLSRSPASGSSSNSSASSHISAVENSSGLSCTPGSSRHEITPRPSGAARSRSAIANCGSPKSSVPPPSSSPTSERSSTPTVAGDSPPIALQLRLALVGVEERQQRAQVGRGRPAAGPSRRRSGRRARGSAPASCWRPAPWPAAAARSPTPSRAPARRRRCRRARGTRSGSRGRERQAELGLALLGRLAAPRPAAPCPDRSPLTSATNTGTPGGRQRLGQQLQRPRLAGAGRARDQAVAVHHRQRDADDRVLVQLALVHAAARARSPRRRSRSRRRSPSRSPAYRP